MNYLNYFRILPSYSIRPNGQSGKYIPMSFAPDVTVDVSKNLHFEIGWQNPTQTVREHVTCLREETLAHVGSRQNEPRVHVELPPRSLALMAFESQFDQSRTEIFTNIVIPLLRDI